MMCRLLFAITLGAAACSRSAPPQPPSPSAIVTEPAKARTWIAAGAAVIDVRTADEYARGHLPNAVNIPVQELPSQLAEVDRLVAGDKARPIVVYCAAGGRAAKAKRALDAAGYAQVVNGGGLGDLAEAPR